MAVTSAWAVGSLVAVTRLTPSNAWPSAVTMMAPNGPPLFRTLAVASSMDLARYCSAVTVIAHDATPFAVEAGTVPERKGPDATVTRLQHVLMKVKLRLVDSFPESRVPAFGKSEISSGTWACAIVFWKFNFVM